LSLRRLDDRRNGSHAVFPDSEQAKSLTDGNIEMDGGYNIFG